jgi:hypothetical protein
MLLTLLSLIKENLQTLLDNERKQTKELIQIKDSEQKQMERIQ